MLSCRCNLSDCSVGSLRTVGACLNVIPAVLLTPNMFSFPPSPVFLTPVIPVSVIHLPIHWMMAADNDREDVTNI